MSVNNVASLPLGTGRKPKMDSELEHKRRAKKAPALGVVPVPPPPKGLSDLESQAWRDLKAMVDPLNVFTEVDLIAFEQAAQSLYVTRAALAAVRADGVAEAALGSRGQPVTKANPSLATWSQAAKLLWFGLSRFGLAPADRARINGVWGGPDDAPADGFAAKRAAALAKFAE